jgi:hypothetical protein
MTDERQPGRRIRLAQFSEEVGEVVVQLIRIGDVAARPGGAVAADVHSDRRHASARQRLRDGVHFH